MYKILNSKKGKLLIGILFVFYLIVLICGILFKDGGSFAVARHMSRLSLNERISFIQIIPFKTIINFFNNDYISFISIIKNIFGNILLFTPLGFLLPLLSEKLKDMKNIFFISFIISFVIEIIQLFSGLGFTDIDDIILNVLGAMFGYFIYKLLFKLLSKK